MKRLFENVFLIFSLLIQSGSIMAILSSSSEYYGEYPPKGYQPEHGPIIYEGSSRNVVQEDVCYWSHEPEYTYDVLSKTPQREKAEVSK